MKLKTLIVAIAAAFCALFATGCSDSPSDVVENFFEASNDVDFVAAKECCTGVMRTLIAAQEEQMNKLSDKEQEKLRAKIQEENGKKFEKCEVVSEDIDGENATVKVTDGEGNDITFKLKKVEGEWKISAR